MPANDLCAPLLEELDHTDRALRTESPTFADLANRADCLDWRLDELGQAAAASGAAGEAADTNRLGRALARDLRLLAELCRAVTDHAGQGVPSELPLALPHVLYAVRKALDQAAAAAYALRRKLGEGAAP